MASDEPKEELTEEELILKSLDGDLNPITPDNADSDSLLNDLNPSLDDYVEPPEPKKEAPESAESSDDAPEEVDELELLKKYGFEDAERIDDVLERHRQLRERTQALGEIMEAAGVKPSDDPLQDVLDLMEQQVMQQRSGSFAGAQPQPQAAPTPEAAPPTAPQAPRPGERTRSLLERYKALNWNESFLQDLAAAVGEHLPHEAPKTDNLASRQEVENMASLNRRLFETNMINEHIVSRLAQGDKLPRNYRDLIASEVRKNPNIMERAWRGFVIRGRTNGILDEYARSIPVERDPDTGLSRAEATAMASERERLARQQRTVQGGDAPKGTPARKPKTAQDLERQIERMGRELI